MRRSTNSKSLQQFSESSSTCVLLFATSNRHDSLHMGSQNGTERSFHSSRSSQSADRADMPVLILLHSSNFPERSKAKPSACWSHLKACKCTDMHPRRRSGDGAQPLDILISDLAISDIDHHVKLSPPWQFRMERHLSTREDVSEMNCIQTL